MGIIARHLHICFNSRTREGCDLAEPLVLVIACLFQFTHPGGVRLKGYCRSECRERVSIHAPGRGATFTCMATLTDTLFQFTHPGGVRLNIGYLI